MNIRELTELASRPSFTFGPNVLDVNREVVKAREALAEHCLNNFPKLLEALSKIAGIKDRYDGGDWDEINEARGIAEEVLKETSEVTVV